LSEVLARSSLRLLRAQGRLYESLPPKAGRQDEREGAWFDGWHRGRSIGMSLLRGYRPGWGKSSIDVGRFVCCAPTRNASRVRVAIPAVETGSSRRRTPRSSRCRCRRLASSRVYCRFHQDRGMTATLKVRE